MKEDKNLKNYEAKFEDFKRELEAKKNKKEDKMIKRKTNN